MLQWEPEKVPEEPEEPQDSKDAKVPKVSKETNVAKVAKVAEEPNAFVRSSRRVVDGFSAEGEGFTSRPRRCRG